MDNERRAQLLATKLRALIASRWDSTDAIPIPYFAGAALYSSSSATAFILVEAREVDADPLDMHAAGPRPVRGWLGGALVAAQRAKATSLVIVADDGTLTGHDVRRANRASISVAVFAAMGRDLVPIEPVSFAAPPTPPNEVLAFTEVIRAGGAVPMIDGDTLVGEVLGLEVARVISDEFGVRLEVGVGRHDRLAQSMMNSQAEPALALREVVETVLRYRHRGASPHPGNTVARARWLREHVVSQPELVGCTSLTRLAGTVPYELKRASVACASGPATREGGFSTIVVGCSVGVDLDAVTDLLDVAALGTEPTEVILCVPVGDDLGALRLLCELFHSPVRLLTIDAPWSVVPI